LSGVHDTTSTGLLEQKHVVGPLFFKLPPVDIELDSLSSNHEDDVWAVLCERSWGCEFRG